jgi:PST family polysaccharide transporter
MRFRSQLNNLTAFTIIQGVSYLIPVVTIPYFARTLGIAGMGQLAIAGAVALAAGVLMDYGIQLSGTRFAASHIDDHAAIGGYLNTTTLAKLSILVPILFGLCLSSLVFQQVSAHFWVFFWSLLSAVTICLFPQWLFQGMLIMPLAARLLVVCRLGAAVAAMLLVQTPDDAFIVPATQAVTGAFALLAAFRMLSRRYGIEMRRSPLDQVKKLFRENWTLFSATAWGAIYAHGGIIIMSTMLSATSIGFYSIAQKISQAFVSMFNVAAQTGFPSFVRSHAETPRKLGSHVRPYIVAVTGAAALTLVIMFALREKIYMFFSGRHNDVGIEIFSIWLVASFFTVISVSLNPVMIVLRLDAPMASVYRLTGLSFLIAAPLACLYFGVVGMAGAMLVTEMTIALFFATSVFGGLGRIKRTVG